MHVKTGLSSLLLVYILSSCGSNGSVPENDQAWMDAHPHDTGLLLSPSHRVTYQEANPDILALRPIATTDTSEAADALGYGVSNLHAGRLAVAHYARACHWGCPEKYPEGTSRAVVTYSDDYGRSWSAGRALDHELSPQKSREAALGWGLAFGQASDTTYLATSRGLFSSLNGGEDWTFVPGLRRGAGGLPGTGYGAGKVHIGPRMIHSKRAGLLLFGQPEDIQAGKLWILQSQDSGQNWEQFVVETGRADVTPVEPTAWKVDEETILFFVRNGPNGQGSNPAQFLLRIDGPGRFRVTQPAITNCTVRGHQDTHDVIHNPVTNQFEATVSDRCESHSDYGRMALSLWTIPAARLLAGDSVWRHEGHYFPPLKDFRDGEGTHPGGSVVDVATGKQYLQIHRGRNHATSSSLYQLERDLATQKVSAALTAGAAPSLVVEDLGKDYAADRHQVPTYGRYFDSDRGGSTSVRRADEDHLKWKNKGYYQRNRDLGQVFNVPEGETLTLSAVVLRTGNSKSAVLGNTAGAPVFLQLFTVTGDPIINDNGTPVGTDAEHGYTKNHRADDYLDGVRYEPLEIFHGGTFPDLPATTQAGGQAGHLRYLRWKLTDPPTLRSGRYAFLVGFEEAAAERGFTLGNHNLAADPAAPALRTDASGGEWWSLRREGDGTLPPTKLIGNDPPADTARAAALRRESLFGSNHYFTLPPTCNGFPDVDTYRTFEFYLEAR